MAHANSGRFAAANLDAKSGGPDYSKMIESLMEGDNLRESFMKACLTKMGLRVAIETPTVPPVLSALHISSLHNVEVSELFDDLKNDVTLEEGESFVKGENDTFLIERNGSPLSLHSLGVSLPETSSEEKDEAETDQLRSGQGEKNIDYNKVIKRLVFHDGGWPQNSETPHFNHDVFYSELVDYQDESGSRAEDFGKVIMYGDVVTSTNTLLEKYVLTKNPMTTSNNCVQEPEAFITPPKWLHRNSNSSSCWQGSRIKRLGFTRWIIDIFHLHQTLPRIVGQSPCYLRPISCCHRYRGGDQDLWQGIRRYPRET